MKRKKKYKISSLESDILLKTIDSYDIERIRKWKNENRFSFFHNKIISKGEQVGWFKNYLERNDDFVFIVEYKSSDIGCIGFRLVDNFIDIYNVILGNKKYSGGNLIGNALKLLCSYIVDNYSNEITCKVLLNNKAIKWYIKNGFIEINKKSDFILMKLDFKNFLKTKYKLTKY